MPAPRSCALLLWCLTCAALLPARAEGQTCTSGFGCSCGGTQCTCSATPLCQVSCSQPCTVSANSSSTVQVSSDAGVDFTCTTSQSCTLVAGAGSTALCQGSGQCDLTVGDGSNVTLDLTPGAVTCTWTCTVSCPLGCTIHCPSGAPVACGGGSYRCGLPCTALADGGSPAPSPDGGASDGGASDGGSSAGGTAGPAPLALRVGCDCGSSRAGLLAVLVSTLPLFRRRRG